MEYFKQKRLGKKVSEKIKDMQQQKKLFIFLKKYWKDGKQ